MQKRGFILLGVLVKLIPVILILLLFLTFFFLFLPALFGTTSKEAKNSFQAMGKAIDNMLSKNSVYDSYELAITMPHTNVVKGFSKHEIWLEKCEGYDCICLYSKYQDISEMKPVDCYSFKNTHFYEKVEFYTLPDPYVDYNLEDPYAGSADPAKRNALGIGELSKQLSYPEPVNNRIYYPLYLRTEPVGGKLALNMIYLEKFSNDKTAYILISKIVDGKAVSSTRGITRQDIKARQDHLKPCPDGSDAECIGRSINNKGPLGFCQLQEGVCKLLELKKCNLNADATEDCLCGNNLMNKGDGANPTTCTKDKQGNYKALPFSCDKVESCKSYCEVKTANSKCEDEAEKSFCAQNPCGVGACAVLPQLFGASLCGEF